LLATISSSAPYIGLLGTVIGIINAFQGLSTTAQLTLSSVAPGISEALVATAVGLLAAIPALIAFNQFSKQLDNLLNGSLAFAEELIIQIAKDK
jgi:biopolymer transport protein TolQ